jgi:hypothetical protein
MSEAEKARILEEESKRLKRNHKIAQLVSPSAFVPGVLYQDAKLTYERRHVIMV